MIISDVKLKELNGEKPQYSDRYHRKAFKSKYQSDLIKGIVEIIKNGVDAYVNESEFEKNKERLIKVYLDTQKGLVRITNFAKGMDYVTFGKALKVGEDTSGNKEGTTGAHGYGMKEAAWAFKQTKIITLRDGLYSSRIFYWDNINDVPLSAWEKDENGVELINCEVNKQIIEISRIDSEGTLFEAYIPEEIPSPRPETLRQNLSNHILLRAINQSNKFKIILEYVDTKNGEVKNYPIKYEPPEILSLRQDTISMDKGNFSFNYPSYGAIDCFYDIYLATRELLSTGDTREAGLLICEGEFSVLDCTLFGHGDRVASRFFGKVILKGKIREICKKERILDDKRESGLIEKTPLYVSLHSFFHKKLEELVDKERKRLNKNTGEVTKGVLENKQDLIKEFNKIDRQENEETSQIVGDIKFTPGENGIRFCVENYLKLVESEEKKVHLVIDPTIIPIGSSIEIVSNKLELEVEPKKFIITKMDVDKDNIFKKKISFKSDSIDSFLVTAYVKGMLNKTELNIEVVRDSRLHIKKPLEFVPDESTIVAGKSKDFSLIIDASRFLGINNISITKDNFFIINQQISLKNTRILKDNLRELLIPIHCAGKPNQKGKITAIIDEVSAELRLEIIDSKDRHLRGDFEGIDEDKTEDPDELGYYDEKKKVIYVCVNHPLLRYYRRNQQIEENIGYRVIYGDVIIREFCKVLARKKVKTFENMTADDYRVKYSKKYEDVYKKHSARLHKFCINPENLEQLRVK